MADTPDTPSSEPSADTPPEQAPLDLVPSFASEEENEQPWSPLTTANSDYERLWSMPNGFNASHEKSPVAEGAPPPAPEPEAPTGTSEPESSPPALEPEAPPPASPTASTNPTPGFSGTLVTGSEVLASSILVGSSGIVLWGGGAEIGTWEHSQAKIARLTFSRFAIQAEGETLTFTADDPSGLDDAIAAATNAQSDPQPDTEESVTPTSDIDPTTADTKLSAETPENPLPAPGTPDVAPVSAPVRRPRIKNVRPEGSEASAPVPDSSPPIEEPPPAPELEKAGDEFTIADSVRASSDRKTVRARRFRPSDLRGMVIKTAVVLGLVAVLAGAAYAVMLLMGRTGGAEDTATNQPEATAPPITIVITTTPPVTVATTAAASLGDSTFFQTDAATLTERWNSLAEISAPNMVLFSDLTSPFILLLTPNVTLEGVLDPVAGNVTMRATPTGTPEGDGAILSALGILIGTADPSLDGSDRKALLAQLGLDVDRPELGGIDGSLTHNGLAYRMVYQTDQNTLEFAITPEGAVTTTAAG